MDKGVLDKIIGALQMGMGIGQLGAPGGAGAAPALLRGGVQNLTGKGKGAAGIPSTLMQAAQGQAIGGMAPPLGGPPMNQFMQAGLADVVGRKMPDIQSLLKMVKKYG